MEKMSFKIIDENLCDECSLALGRFIGHMLGIDSIEVESGYVVIKYDESKITKEELQSIARDSIEKLGYKIVE